MSGRTLAFSILLTILISQPALADVSTAQWLVVNEYGGANLLRFPPDTALRMPPISKNGLRSVSWGESSALAVGVDNTAGLLDANGDVIDGFADLGPLAGEVILGTAWGVDAWLVAGTRGKIVRVSSGGVAGPTRTLFGGSDVFALAWGGAEWLAGGADGQVRRVTADGIGTGTAFQPLGGSAISAIASDGSNWLVGGPTDEVCLVNAFDEVDRCMTVPFESVSAIAWNGTNWVVCGDLGMVLTIGADDAVSDPQSILRRPITAISASRTGGGLFDGSTLVVGQSGEVRKLDVSGAPLSDGESVFGGVDAHGLTWTGSGWLVVGGHGAVSVVAPDGTPSETPAPIQLLDPNTQSTAVGWNGTGWLVANHDETQWVDSAGVPSEETHSTGVSSSPGVASLLSWNGTNWLFASVRGELVLLDETGAPVDGFAPSSALDGAEIHSVGWNGDEWLLGGPGVVRRMGADGVPAAAIVAVLDGVTVETIAWTGNEWLVAGCGAIQRVRRDGLPIGSTGSYVPVLDDECVWDLAWNGDRLLAVGEGGRVQLVDKFGTPAGGVAVALSGNTARAAAWIGTHWVVVGGYGNAQLVSAEGAPLDLGANVVGWPAASSVASNFPATDGSVCSTFGDCASRLCNAGVCCIGCLISGECHAPAEKPIDDQCAICDPALAVDSWSVDEGELCDDEKFCTSVDVCSSRGDCVGAETASCADLDDQCSVGVCNPITDQCERDPSSLNGQLCSDGVFCNGEERCNGGDCVPGVAPTCDHLDEDCIRGFCHRTLDECQADATALDGDLCEDDSYCNGADHCQNGSCVPFEDPIDCSELSNECATGACDEDTLSCIEIPFDVGAICRGGTCTGQTAVPPGTCDAEGACLETERIECGEDVACSVGICEFDCDESDECPLGAFCHPTRVCRPPNRAPQADAGADQTVPANTTVTLDGRASADPDGDSLTYRWRQVDGPEGELVDADSPVASLSPPQDWGG